MNRVLVPGVADAEDVFGIRGVPEGGVVAEVGLGGEQEFEGDVLRSGWVGEEFVGFVVCLELAAEVRGVGFLVLEEFVVGDCGVGWVGDVVGLRVDGLGEVGGGD